VSHPLLRALVLALALGAGACALTSKSTPIEIHYFTPEAPAPSLTSSSAGRAPDAIVAGSRPRLRVGRVTSSAHLRSRVVFRRSAVELGAYEDRRWTENPEMYVRRSLETALFDDRRVVQSVAGGSPTLDVELVAFEEVRRGSARGGRIDLFYVLHDEENVLASGRLAVERDARSGETSDVVLAIAAAMNAATAELSRLVAERLGDSGH